MSAGRGPLGPPTGIPATPAGGGRGNGGARVAPRPARSRPHAVARVAARAGRPAVAADDGLRGARARPGRSRPPRVRRDRRSPRPGWAARRPAARQRDVGLVLGRGRPGLRQRPASPRTDRRRRPTRRRGDARGRAARARLVRPERAGAAHRNGRDGRRAHACRRAARSNRGRARRSRRAARRCGSRATSRRTDATGSPISGNAPPAPHRRHAAPGATASDARTCAHAVRTLAACQRSDGGTPRCRRKAFADCAGWR
jgi:hypothetical protein